MNNFKCSIVNKSIKEIDLIIDQTIKEINSENLIIVPTETVYGLTAKITKNTISKIYNIKNRNTSKPIPIIIGNVDDLEKLTTKNENTYIKNIIEKYWPGPLTIIFNKNKNNKDLEFLNLIGDKETIGIRMPKQSLLLQILKKTGPLLCTSANISGCKSPNSLLEIPDRIKKTASLIIDNDIIKNGIPSTIIDMTKEKPFILRIGEIKETDIESIINRRVKII